MSQGIGLAYFNSHDEALFNDELYLVNDRDSVIKIKLPRYFLNKAEEQGYNLDELKERRKTVGVISQRELEKDGIDEFRKRELDKAKLYGVLKQLNRKGSV